MLRKSKKDIPEKYNEISPLENLDRSKK